MITAILAAVCLAWFLVYFIEWQRKAPLLNRKPFNCVPCLSAWTSLLLYFLPHQAAEAVLCLFSAAILGIVLETKMKSL